MTDIKIYNPDGIPGTIPAEQKDEALAQGYTLSAPTVSLSGNAEGHPISPAEVTPPEPAGPKTFFRFPLVNAEGKHEWVDETEADEKLASGKYTVPEDIKQVPVVKLDGDVPGHIPGDQAPAALASGEYRLQTQQEQEQAALTQSTYNQAKKEGLSSAVTGTPITGEATPIDVGLTRFGQQLPGHDIGAAIGNAIYPSPEYVQQGIKAGEEKYLGEHPIASAIGTTAGAAANIALTASGAGALSKGFGLAGLGKAAAEGAVFGLEPTVANIINKNPGTAAEDFFISTGANMLLHGGFSALSKVVEKAGVALTDAETANLAEHAANVKQSALSEIAEKLNIPPAEAEKASQALGAAAKQGLIVDSIPQTLKNLAEAEGKNTKLLSALDQLDAMPNKGLLLGRGISDLMEQVSTSPPIMDQLQKVAENPSFRGLQEAKNAIGKMKLEDAVKVPALDAISQTQNTLEQQAVSQLEKVDKPLLMKSLQDARQLEAVSKTITSIMSSVPKTEQPDLFSAALQVGKGLMGHGTHTLGLGFLAHLVAPHIGLPIVGAVKVANAGRQLYKLLQEPSLGSALGKFTSADEMILKAQQARNSAIEVGVKSVIEHLGGDNISKTATLTGLRGLKDLLPNGGTGQTDKQQLAIVRKNMSQATDPNQLTQNLAPVIHALNEAGLSKVADAYTIHQARLLKVLDTILPKHDIMAANPFSSKVDISEISEAAKTKYQRALTLSLDPDKLLEMIKNNTISTFDVAIVAATNPETLQRMRQELQDQAMTGKKLSLSYQQSLSMSIMLGTHLDESTQQVPVLQGIYPATPTPPDQGSGGKGKKPSASKTKEMSQNYLSPTQKVISGE